MLPGCSDLALWLLGSSDPEATKLTSVFSSSYFDLCFSEEELISSLQKGTFFYVTQKPLPVGLCSHWSAQTKYSSDNFYAAEHQRCRSQSPFSLPNPSEALGSVWLSHDEIHPQLFRLAETVEHKIPQKELSSRPLFQVSHEK